MIQEFSGALNGSGLKIGVVVSRFNELISRNLLAGAVDALKRHGVVEDHIAITWVPGAYEIPLIAQTMAQTGNYHAVVCLGAVIRGATAHFDYVAGQASSGIANASLQTGIPILFGVLTTDTIEQAIERSGTKCGNKGCDTAVAAIEMANLMNQLKAPCPTKRQVKLPAGH